MRSTNMKNISAEVLERTKSDQNNAVSFSLGRIIRIAEDGQVFVNFPGSRVEERKARVAVELSAKLGASWEEGLPVILMFEDGDVAKPIILGVIRDTVHASLLQEIVVATERQREGLIDRKQVVFDAKEEIVLRCGKGSITLRKDGKIVLKGTEIVSRASRTNKIKGASVAIN